MLFTVKDGTLNPFNNHYLSPTISGPTTYGGLCSSSEAHHVYGVHPKEIRILQDESGSL